MGKGVLRKMNIMSNFSETLYELMNENNLTSRALANAIGVSHGNISMWVSGKCKLTLTNALKLADFFECSLEFLMGRTDKRLDYVPSECPPFYDSLMSVMKEQKISRYRIVKDTAFSNGYFTRWKNGSSPLIETVITLAEYFGCSLDYLVGRDR